MKKYLSIAFCSLIISVFTFSLLAQEKISNEKKSGFSLSENFDKDLEAITLKLEQKVNECYPKMANKSGILKITSCAFTKGESGLKAAGHAVAAVPGVLLSTLKLGAHATWTGAKALAKMGTNVLKKQALTTDLDKVVFDAVTETAQDSAAIMAKLEKDKKLQEQVLAKLLSLMPLTASKENRNKLLTLECDDLFKIACRTVGELGVSFITKYAILTTKSKGDVPKVLSELIASGDIDIALRAFRSGLVTVGIADIVSPAGISEIQPIEKSSIAE